MREFDVQLLVALDRASSERGNGWVDDLLVHEAGWDVFGDDWAGETARGKRYAYSPVVAMGLGRLRAADLVRRRSDDEESFSTWKLTAVGAALLREMGVEAHRA